MGGPPRRPVRRTGTARRLLVEHSRREHSDGEHSDGERSVSDCPVGEHSGNAWSGYDRLDDGHDGCDECPAAHG